MNRTQLIALDYLRLARSFDPTTWDGVLTNDRTMYDQEVHMAHVHWKTADALVRQGLVVYGERDPEHGTEVRLV